MDKNLVYDAVIIGAGHNGLVCGAYLARHGLKTLIVERKGIVGGACVTEELFPGIRASTAACWFGMLREEIIRDLDLYKHGLDVVPMDPQVVALFPDGTHIDFWLNDYKTFLSVLKSLGVKALRELIGLIRFNQDSSKISKTLSAFLIKPAMSISEMAASFQDAGVRDPEQIIFKASIRDLLDEYFVDEKMKAAIGFSGLAVTNSSPYIPETAFGLFYMLTANTSGISKAWGYAIGGMGSVTTAILASARESGADLRTNSDVQSVIIENGKAIGIRLGNGEEIKSSIVVSNADPKTTFKNLVGDSHLDAIFVDEIDKIRNEGKSSVIHFVLNELPEFRGKNRGLHRSLLKGLLVIAPSLPYMHEASEISARGELPPNLLLTISFPSLVDRTLVEGKSHLMSVYVQFTPYSYFKKEGEAAKEKLALSVVSLIDNYAPGFESSIIKKKVFSPIDLEIEFGLPNGHPEHSDMVLSQMFSNRPVDNWNEIGSPIQNLYLCGSGTHPGGTVTGAPGYNAAHAIISSMKNQE